MAEPPSSFRDQVYQIVRTIPPGRVMTYGQIAGLIPPPQGIVLTGYVRVRARWVGYAMARCPEDVPWHRVVNSQGGISPRPGHGPHVQRILLEEEGVILRGNGRLDLAVYRWDPQEAQSRSPSTDRLPNRHRTERGR
jgi:methylated-DNA-protein-cysteine methyltransferase-like protein